MDFGTLKFWTEKINQIKKEVNQLKPKYKFFNDCFLSKDLFKLFINKLKSICSNKKVAIMFSGGVDSTVIAIMCKNLGLDYICYSVGFQDEETKFPEDIKYSIDIAKKYNLKFQYKIFNLKEMEQIIKKTCSILSKNKKAFDVVNVSVGAVEVAAFEMAKKDKSEIILSGLGSEEIFAGYQRHEQAKDKHEECWNGLLKMHTRDLIRETLISEFYNLESYAPCMDEDIIKLAMQISIKSKINKKQNKIVIRKFAKKLGLKEFSYRKKRAAQYGSRFSNALDKLANKNKFKYKLDYINSLIKSK